MKISLFIFLISSLSFAQVVDEVNSEAVKEISQITKNNLVEELKELKQKSLSTVEMEIQTYNQKVLYYVQLREKECKGEFSSIEINDQGESELVKRKLSNTEKKLCLIELVNFRKTYINEIFEIRKKILLENHSKQLQELDEIQKESIKKMDDLVLDLTK